MIPENLEPIDIQPGPPTSRAPGPWRSATWLADQGKTGVIARSHLLSAGHSPEDFDGRPVIGIANTWSQLNPCNLHLRGLAEAAARGVIKAGGLPLEFPIMSLGEPFMRPTSMLYRNLAAMELEETVRANPIDGVLLLSGCDKTTPALLMGALSVDVPTVLLTGGPMLSGRFRGAEAGSGTWIWRVTEEVRSGRAPASDLAELENCLSRSAGHCMTMGTASTMACLTEAMGIQVHGAASVSAVDAGRTRLAEHSGVTAVHAVLDDRRPSTIITRDSLRNAVTVNAAIGGSTNAVLHLLAIAGRAGVKLTLDDIDAWSRDVPFLVDLAPSGRLLMPQFDAAGGIPALMGVLGDLLIADCVTVEGRTMGALVAAAPAPQPVDGDIVIRPLDDALTPAGSGVAVLRGNLAPDGAVLKQSAASPHFFNHRGRARVFDSLAGYRAVAGDPDADFTPDDVIVLRYAGPVGYPGMPEVGNLELPVIVLAQGVTDMVRITDARMSGTAYGTVILHVSPEAAVGGPLALLRDGDIIEVDVPGRRLEMLVDSDTLEERRREWTNPVPVAERGWQRLFQQHVLQADQGVDLDFLVGCSGSAVPPEAF